MAEKERLYEFVCAHIDGCFDDGDFIDIWNEELEGDHTDLLDDNFNDYVSCRDFLDVYNNLSPRFNASETFFSETNDGYETSNELFDFIDKDDVITWVTDRLAELNSNDLKDEINPSNYRYHGFGKLVKLYRAEIFEPKHSEAEIKQKIRETISTFDEGQLQALLNLEKRGIMRMKDFPAYVASRPMYDVIAELVRSLPCGCFRFSEPFFSELEGDSFLSYTMWDAGNEAFNNFDRIDDSELECRFPNLAKYKKGLW